MAQGSDRDYVVAARAARAALGRARAAQRRTRDLLRDGELDLDKRKRLRAESVQPFDRDVLDVLIEQIALYSRTRDAVGARQIASHLYGVDHGATTGYQRDRVGASLRRLHLNGVIEVDTSAGRRARTVISFPLEEHSAPELDSTAEDSAPALQSEEEHSAPIRETQRACQENTARRVGHSGKNSGKNSGERPALGLEEQAILRWQGKGNVTDEEIQGHLTNLRADGISDEIIEQALEAHDQWPSAFANRARTLHGERASTPRPRPAADPHTTCLKCDLAFIVDRDGTVMCGRCGQVRDAT
jgi:hypothetical protein